MKKVALYDPYLDILGGGEKHILSILKALEDCGFELNVFWDTNLQDQIEARFKLSYQNKLKFLPNIFKKTDFSFLTKFNVLKDFDIFFYVTDGSYFFSVAKKNFVFCMAPKKDLYQMSLINKLKTRNFRFISNSSFTKKWLERWGIESITIYPYISEDFINLDIKKVRKKKIILSVGRFYQHLHAKKQSVIIDMFKKMKQDNHLLKDFKLFLAGGLKEENKQYFEMLRSTNKSASDIELLANPSFEALSRLYRDALLYLHFTGYGIDETENPEHAEHLGIAPLEAMANGCITYCYNAGGPKEIVMDHQNGFLFESYKDLASKIVEVLDDAALQNRIQNNAKAFVKKNFSYDVFKKRVKQVLL